MAASGMRGAPVLAGSRAAAGPPGQPSPGPLPGSGAALGCAGLWAGTGAHGELWHCGTRAAGPGAAMGTYGRADRPSWP